MAQGGEGAAPALDWMGPGSRRSEFRNSTASNLMMATDSKTDKTGNQPPALMAGRAGLRPHAVLEPPYASMGQEHQHGNGDHHGGTDEFNGADAPGERERYKDIYADLYHLAPVGYIDFDAKGSIRRINRTGATFLGRAPQELIGKPFVPFIVTRDIQKFVAHLRHCVQPNAERRTLDLRLRVKGSENIAVQLWSIGFRDPASNEMLCRSTLTDITERKLAEEALHESKECFRFMTDTAPVLVWMSGPDGLCTYFNRAWMDFTGRSLKQELGKGWLEAVHPDDLPHFLDAYHTAFETHDQLHIEFRLRRSDQEYRWFLNTGVPRFTRTGSFAGYIGSCIDITERKEAEELRRQILEDLEVIVQERTANLKAANRKLRREVTTRKRLEKQIVEIADREKQRIGNDLHDGIGQQLTGVAFLSKLLEQKLTNKSLKEAADAAQIHSLVNTALSQTRELARGLHVVELAAGGLESALQEFRDQIENLFNLNCQLRYDKSLNITDPAVATHVFRIAQEAVNNAIKHGQATKISIHLSKAEKRILLKVKDDGIGFQTIKGKEGMGMHTMRYRTEMIRGTFEIQRLPEGGTLVCCSFPLTSTRKK